MEKASSPRPWGCFLCRREAPLCWRVFPTPVGVFPPPPAPPKRRRLPHARGGVSNFLLLSLKYYESSPRPWGCFWRSRRGYEGYRVFPTPVGVFLLGSSGAASPCRLPHARGGVSPARRPYPRTKRSSPRPWGCFYLSSRRQGFRFVFPTPVGVFPMSAWKRPKRPRLPHARGGVSTAGSP